MKINKKAALDLSMNTIVVIVIGVTILSLGLIWVQNTFRDVGDVSDQAFLNAQEVLSSDQEFGGRLSAASTFRLEKGKPKVLIIKVRNDGSEGSNTFTITGPDKDTTLSDITPDTCIKTKIVGDPTKQIPEGQTANFDVGFITDKNCNVGTNFYNLKINGDYATHTVSVTIE